VPYWTALRKMVDRAKESYSTIVHINCHSMPSVPGCFATEQPSLAHPDIVLGNRDGSTCANELMNFLKEVCEKHGLNVKLNDPYKGVAIVRDIGKPAEGVHSVQVEINRRLYMNESTRELNPGYKRIKVFANALIAAAAQYATEQNKI
jgi:N-formylglutamate deformylase